MTPTSMDVRRLSDYVPEMDSFSLPWVLAWALKEYTLEGDFDSSYDGREFVKAFQRFRSGLGEIETLAHRLRDEPVCGEPHGRRGLCQVWASMAIKRANIAPYDGASKHLAKLFEEMKTPSVSA
ncbi:hypothetical protein HY546_02965 [archaeon]|nr:hypothetical protein [archaeon]